MNDERLDDQVFELARDTWRQFYRYRIDLPAPTQPEIDARLIRYQQVESVSALQSFVVASLLLVAIGHAIIDAVEIFSGANTLLEASLFIITCAIFVVAAIHALNRVNEALHHRTIAMRIHVDGVPWESVRSMFADTENPDVRTYIAEVHRQGRTLRRAEAAALMERMHAGGAVDDAGAREFHRAVRARDGVKARELVTAAICGIVILLASPAARIEPASLMPGLFVLGAWALADGLSTLLQWAVDPWQLRAGESAARELRNQLLLDLSPPAAILLGVFALHVGLVGVI